MEIKVKKNSKLAKLPSQSSSGSAGYDLYSFEKTIIPPSKVVKGYVDIGRGLVRTGIHIEIPKGFAGRVCSRSGLSVTKNIEIGAGLIDSDYRGEILIEVKNFSSKPFSVKRGLKIAQIVFIPIGNVSIKLVKRLSVTTRGEKGFGSSD